jgi:hypothetical protein
VCEEDAIVVLEEFRPEEMPIGNKVFVVSDTADPTLDVNSSAIVPGVQLWN